MRIFVLFPLSLIGLFIALYFALVYYRLLRPDTRLVPAFCRMSGDSCLLIVHHPDASILGLPNAVYGVGLYLLVIASLLLPGFSFLHTMALIASWSSVAAAIYLLHSLIFKIRVACPLCIAAHIVNIILAVMLTAK